MSSFQILVGAYHVASDHQITVCIYFCVLNGERRRPAQWSGMLSRNLVDTHSNLKTKNKNSSKFVILKISIEEPHIDFLSPWYHLL